jgi:hypothetical protein
LLVAQIVAWLVVSSAMIQQVGDLAADVSRAAEIAGQTSPQTPLVSDEQAMTSYYAGRVALPYRLPIRFRRAVVVLHDRYVDLHAERAKLERDFEVRELGSAFAQGAHGAAWRAVVWSISRRGRRAASVSTAPTTAPGG